MEMPDSELEMISITVICRLCANQNDKLIGIYSEDGINNELANKMNIYLPVKVAEDDDLPLQCCWQCASTVLAWHDLVLTSVEADRRLRSYQFVTAKQLNFVEEETVTLGRQEEVEPIHTSLNAFCQTETNTQNLQEKANKSRNSPISSEYVETDHDNLSEFVNIEHPYLHLNNDNIYDIKIEEKTLPTRTNVELPQIYQEESKGTLINLNKQIDLEADNKSLYNFGCQHCSMMFLLEEDIVAHLNDAHPSVSVNIEAMKIKLQRLKKERHKEKENETDIGSHELDAETDKSMYNYGCDRCPMMFVLEEEVVEHLNRAHADDITESPKSKDGIHKIKKERRKNNKIDQDLVNSAKVVVDGRIYYNCTVCGKSLHSPYTYVWHMRIHTGERPYVCDLCGKQFRVSQGLVRHLKETHEGIKNFPCDLCGRMFATRRNVEEHRRIHTNERPYICDLCGKSFKQKASLFVHNRSHTDSFPFKCTYCNQAFRTKPPLLIHITKHTGEKPYQCDICGRCFRIKYELKRHRLIHSDEKPFLCTLCGLSFRQKRYLRNHNKLNHSVQ